MTVPLQTLPHPSLSPPKYLRRNRCIGLVMIFSIIKTKAMVIMLANHTGHKHFSEPIKTQSKCVQRRSGNACERDVIGFGFTSDWLRKWRDFF